MTPVCMPTDKVNVCVRISCAQIPSWHLPSTSHSCLQRWPSRWTAFTSATRLRPNPGEMQMCAPSSLFPLCFTHKPRTLHCRVTSHRTHALNATTLSSDRSSPSIRTRGTAIGIIAPHHCAIPATRSHPHSPHPSTSTPTAHVRSNNHRHSKVCGTDRPRCSRGENQEWHACWKFSHPPEG
jgi:hypothetical protein